MWFSWVNSPIFLTWISLRSRERPARHGPAAVASGDILGDAPAAAEAAGDGAAAKTLGDVCSKNDGDLMVN